MTQLQRTTVTPVLGAGTWDIDPSHSSVEFVARHLVARIRGRFADFTGTIEIGADPTDSAVEATIRAASLDTYVGPRDQNLRAAEYLDVERFPTLTFRSSAVHGVDGDRAFRLDGDLTIRDVTRPVSLDLEYLGCGDDPWGGTRAGFSARTEIDRDDFGVRGNVVLETGGLLVGKV
ncbi:MAG: polyisoprenoid-binding protein, partial [Acidimicrobiales bacterium]|nr:polyisoprenoid-binding protein [Acidimicrobiales bacterium]